MNTLFNIRNRRLNDEETGEVSDVVMGDVVVGALWHDTMVLEIIDVQPAGLAQMVADEAAAQLRHNQVVVLNT